MFSGYRGTLASLPTSLQYHLCLTFSRIIDCFHTARTPPGQPSRHPSPHHVTLHPITSAVTPSRHPSPRMLTHHPALFHPTSPIVLPICNRCHSPLMIVLPTTPIVLPTTTYYLPHNPRHSLPPLPRPPLPRHPRRPLSPPPPTPALVRIPRWLRGEKTGRESR